MGWEMDLSEEWYKGNGMGVPEGSGVKKRGEGEDWGGFREKYHTFFYNILEKNRSNSEVIEIMMLWRHHQR